MSDELNPVLSAETWRMLDRPDTTFYGDEISYRTFDAAHDAFVEEHVPISDKVAIALHNHWLPDDSPYKITWAMMDSIRDAARGAEDDGHDGSGAYKAADVLASYLPPRVPVL